MDDDELAIVAETPRDHELLKRGLWDHWLDPSWPETLFDPLEIPTNPSDDQFREIIVAYIEGVWSGRHAWQPAWIMISRDFENSNAFNLNKESFEALEIGPAFQVSNNDGFFDKVKRDMIMDGWWADPSFRDWPNDDAEAWAAIGKLLVLREYQKIVCPQKSNKNRKRLISKTELAFHILNLVTAVPGLSISKACELILNFPENANGFDAVKGFKARYTVFRSSLKRVRNYISEGKLESEISFIHGRII